MSRRRSVCVHAVVWRADRVQRAERKPARDRDPSDPTSRRSDPSRAHRIAEEEHCTHSRTIVHSVGRCSRHQPPTPRRAEHCAAAAAGHVAESDAESRRAERQPHRTPIVIPHRARCVARLLVQLSPLSLTPRWRPLQSRSRWSRRSRSLARSPAHRDSERRSVRNKHSGWDNQGHIEGDTQTRRTVERRDSL